MPRAAHAAEIFHVFETLDYRPDSAPPATEADRVVSAAMHARWVDFAKTGAPGADWPAYIPADDAWMARQLDAAIGGGAEIYALAMPSATEIHLTVVQAAFEGDAFFPEIPDAEFRLAHSESIEASIPYVFSTYERIARP